MNRCKWSEESEMLQQYHDNEWGKYVAEDNALFECLTLELFQSGLSWKTILHKRENFRSAFAQFEIEKVMQFGEKEIEVLLEDAGIVRHRKKIEATIENAKRVHELVKKFGSFEAFLKQLPPETEEKQKVLRKTFKHVGLTTAESFLEATGRIPASHSEVCFMASK
ncbi:DNA-3-methyladenine glycosylase I [Fictibacillus phosphorivorans]|uniref:DNA-3-methyladenine glycosylase I n=1 Tax=Fictibacillus phosphorivorans TaxID=1221500 RepID=UPI0012939062|nr:DNA-3-methyladenine glycosylase I [Fictibacillus phosphorivorans]MQR93860.1 DNA-3-methyladenine glycosylase I [Fictibacillus phosphorivorans]